MSGRVKSILMVLGGALFTLVGFGLLGAGQEKILALGLIFFFGAVTIVGLVEVLPGPGLPPVAIPIAGLLMGVGCGILAYLLITDPDQFSSSRYPPEVMIPVTIIGAVFFGLGSLLVLLLLLRGRMSADRE